MTRLHVLLVAAWLAGGDVRRRVARSHERGDIPGWVMIAIMSAAVVVVLIPLVGPTIAHAFSNAIDNVSNTQSTGG